MESITIKVDPAFAKEIEKAMKPFYSTKTEFIRAALREKLENEKRKARMLRAIEEDFPKKTTPANDEEDRRIREAAGRVIAKRYGIELPEPATHKNSSGARPKATSRSF